MKVYTGVDRLEAGGPFVDLQISTWTGKSHMHSAFRLTPRKARKLGLMLVQSAIEAKVIRRKEAKVG